MAGQKKEKQFAHKFRQRARRRTLLLTSAAVIAVAAPARAEDINVTSSTSNVNLDTYAGTTARISPGVTVSNGVTATTHAWTVTNDGTVRGGNSVQLNQGGTFVNSSGASIAGTGTAITFGYLPSPLPPAGGPGYLENYGTIAGAVEGVTMWLGGTVTNHQGGIISTTGGGNAVSVGQGTSRIVVNSGEIHADATSGFATGILVQGGPATVTNNTTGVVTGGYNGVYASPSATLTFTNNGSITSIRGPAVEAAGGGTFVNTGTIRSGADGMLISGATAATVTNSGTIGSTGAGRAIVFSGASTHTLNLQTGSVLNGNVQGGTGTDNLVLQGSGTESIAKFLSFETLTMQGTDWSISGAGVFTTGTSVQNGILRVNGTLTSPTIAVGANGTLGGTGTIVGAVTNNGNLAPGNSIGTLSITGNYIQATGSTYTVEVNRTGQSDLLNVTGSVTILSGTTANVIAAPGFYTVGQRYTILHALGGVSGAYTTLTDNAPFVDFALSYDPNNVFLDVTRSSVAFTQIAQTPNQRAAAGAVEQLGAGNRIFDAVLSLETPNALSAFDHLSGEIYASANGSLIEETSFLRNAVTARLAQFGTGPNTRGIAALTFDPDGSNNLALTYAGRAPARDRDPALQAIAKASTPAAAQFLTTWTLPYGSWARTGSDGNAATLSRRSGGFLGGIDTTMTFGATDWWRFGLAGGIQHASLDADDRTSSASIDSYLVALYGGTQQGPIGLRVGSSFGWHDLKTNRTIAFPGFSDSTTASYGATTAQVFGEAGYSIGRQRFALEPFAGFAWVSLRTDGFTESGGAAALNGSSDSTTTSFTTLGLRTSAPLPWHDGILARATVAWRHAFSTVTPTADLTFASTATPFTVAGVPIARDAALIDIGLEGSITRDTVIGIGYTGQLGSDASQHGVSARLVRRF